MPFLLLLLLSLARLQTHWDRPDWLGLDAAGCALVTWVGILAFWLLVAAVTSHFRRQLLRQPTRRTHWISRFAAWKRFHAYALVAFYLVALYFLGWGWTIKSTLAPSRWAQLGIELVMLTPMFTGLFVCWAHYYDLDRTVYDISLFSGRDGFLGRWNYVILQARQNLLLLVPPLFVIVLEHLLIAVFPDFENDNSLVAFFFLVLLVAAFFSIPLLLRWFLGLTPLPPGPLRDRLEATARKLHLRINNILLWNTRCTVANAMVTGMLPWLRYVVVSDRLVEYLTPDEVEAVFGHEVGHIKHHHMSFYLLFVMTSLIAFGLVWFGVFTLGLSLFPESWNWAELFELHSVLPQLLLITLYMLVVFGFVSRRCERQADLYGCRVVSTSTFIDALEKVAVLNGIPRDRPGLLSSWQHGSIAQRIGFLRRVQEEPGLEGHFQRRLTAFKWWLAIGLVALSGIGWALLGPSRVGELLASGTSPPVAAGRN